MAGEVFTLQPLQLYAITQQLRLAKPTCSNGDAKADLGHILDFTCRLKYLKVKSLSFCCNPVEGIDECEFDLYSLSSDYRNERGSGVQ